jgi:hypothetical protein
MAVPLLSVLEHFKNLRGLQKEIHGFIWETP